MKVVSVDDGTVRRTLTCHLALSSCAVSPNEQYVFIGSWDNNVYMYSVSSSKAIDKLPAHEDAVSAICATENRLLTCSWDATVKVLTNSALLILIIFSCGNTRKKACLRTLYIAMKLVKLH